MNFPSLILSEIKETISRNVSQEKRLGCLFLSVFRPPNPLKDAICTIFNIDRNWSIFVVQQERFRPV